MPVDTEALARGVLESVSDDTLVLSLPGTDYKLKLAPTVEAALIETPPGKRIRGSIRAKALRMHPAEGGGRFIEPVHGAPRIVAGTILAIDEAESRVLVDVAVPMWVTWPDGQDTSFFEVGRLVNFYVESGTSFTPA